MKVRTDPVLEAIAKKLIGFSSVPMDEQGRMIHRAAKAAKGAADESIRREVIEECAKMLSDKASVYARSSREATNPNSEAFDPDNAESLLSRSMAYSRAAAQIRALSDPLPESRSVVPDAKEG